MQREQTAFDSLDNPILNAQNDSSESEIQTQPTINYTGNALTEQIFYPDEPPSYESIQANDKYLNQQPIYYQVPSKRRQYCHRHRSVIIATIAGIIIMIIIVFSVGFAAGSKKGVPCDRPSSNGKSCSEKSATNVQLTRITSHTSGPFQFSFYSFQYVAKSNSDVITFSFDRGSNWYLDDLSVRDSLTDVELVGNGDFESGTLNTYCVCSVNFVPSKTTISPTYSGSYAYDASNFFSAVKLSQSLGTVPGRSYDVSFWLNNPTNWQSPLTVYMSRANQYSFQPMFLLSICFFLIEIKHRQH